ncbi:MAG: aldo/keto reductase, partial [Desulfatibacillaceae bacterium]|nr:aldo/keto reductase [Desulfatibacillaceae bacterium]
MAEFERVKLGRTGLMAGPLGLGGAYGAPAKAYEMAFEQGCNYFYHGASRSKGMAKAVKTLVAKGKRDEMVVVVQSFSRIASIMEISVNRALKSLGVDHADILLLGWHNKQPGKRLWEKALDLKQKGKVGHLGLSGHNRKLFPIIAKDEEFDILHF